MGWYFDHVNTSTDVWGLTGTIYDYAVSNGTTGGCATSPCSADSVDAYASSFLSLAWWAWNTGDLQLRNLILSHRSSLDMIAGTLSDPKSLDSSDGLTWAYPGYGFKFLSDNCEGYAALLDYSNLVQAAFNDSNSAASWSAEAANMKTGILTFWNSAKGTWSVDKSSNGTYDTAQLSDWYPDAVAQIYPVVFGVVTPTDDKAVAAYASLNNAFPNWDTFQFNDSFPWAIVGYAATLMGDSTRAVQYRQSVDNRFVNVNPSFPYPWYDAEAGWFVRMLSLQEQMNLP